MTGPFAMEPRLERMLSLARGLTALFWLSLRQFCRARRFLILVFLFLLPGILGVLIQVFAPFLEPRDYRSIAVFSILPGGDLTPSGLIYAARLVPGLNQLEFALVLTLIPHALLPLCALLFASGMIQDELEDQTLTYLFMRPLPKWAIYLVKLAAALFVCLALALVFTVVTYVAFTFGTPALSLSFLWPRLVVAIPAAALATVCYCALFGCLGLLTRRTLVAGGAYIVLIEGVLANIDFALRRLTVVYYFRVLVQRWSGASELLIQTWSIDLAKAPSAAQCIGTMAVASGLFVIAALVLFSSREFRVKTPEGS
jgi:ABC-2 type transport system permease protein